MSLACFRRRTRPEDQLPEAVRSGLAVVGGDLRFERSRLVATTDDTTYWAMPTRDEGCVFYFGANDQGGGSGGTTTLDALRDLGLATTVGLHRGRCRYALLVADGYQRARAGGVGVPVVDNFAVLDLPDRERIIEVIGPAALASSISGRRSGTTSRLPGRVFLTRPLRGRGRAPRRAGG